MQSRGMNHFGLVTHDLEMTIDFYEGVLGFEPVAYYLRELNGGHLRQVFFDIGGGQTLEFAQSHGAGFSPDFDAGINVGLGVGTVYGVGPIHFAFEAHSLTELEERKASLESAGCAVLGPLDLDWVHSIYFTDPNGVQLEFAFTVKAPPADQYLAAPTTDRWAELADS